MKLDPMAMKEVFAEVQELSDEDPASVEESKAIAIGLIETYLRKLGADDQQLAIINLTNARNGLAAIITTCAKAEAIISTIQQPGNKELCDAFIGYIRIIAVQADAHISGNLN